MRDSDEAMAALARDRDKAALDYILKKYIPLAESAARRYFMPGSDKEDLVQEGMIGLYRAILAFDESRNRTGFGSFAKVCVERQIQTAVKGALRGKHSPLKGYAAITVNQTRADDVESPENIVISREGKAALEAAMNSVLSPFERKILLLFMTGHSYQEIALEAGCDKKSVDNGLQRIRRKLKAEGI